MRRVAALTRGLALVLAAACVPAAATEFRSVAQPAILYDGPSKQARKLFAAPRGMPLELISTVGAWVKVRDIGGDVMWIERGDLVERRSVVTATPATVRQQPQDAATIVLQTDRGVLLDLEPGAGPPTPGWTRVRHRDGGSGWVRNTEVWGL